MTKIDNNLIWMTEDGEVFFISEVVRACGVISVSFAGWWLLKNVVLHHLEKLTLKTKNKSDEFFVGQVRDISPIFYVVLSLFLTSRVINLPPTLSSSLYTCFLCALSYVLVTIISNTIAFYLRPWKESATQIERREMMENSELVVRILLWVCAALFILDNIGYNISTLTASLGVGGVAVALASQAVLKDAFSSLVLHIDKPFKMGDVIDLDGKMGTVKKVGLKTTQLEGLDGELLVVSNYHLTEGMIRNFNNTVFRRSSFKLKLVPETKIEKVKKVRKMVESIFEELKADASLSWFGLISVDGSGMNFEGAYKVLSGDYGKFISVQELFNLRVLEEMEKEHLVFALPLKKCCSA